MLAGAGGPRHLAAWGSCGEVEAQSCCCRRASASRSGSVRQCLEIGPGVGGGLHRPFLVHYIPTEPQREVRRDSLREGTWPLPPDSSLPGACGASSFQLGPTGTRGHEHATRADLWHTCHQRGLPGLVGVCGKDPGGGGLGCRCGHISALGNLWLSQPLPAASPPTSHARPPPPRPSERVQKQAGGLGRLCTAVRPVLRGLEPGRTGVGELCGEGGQRACHAGSRGASPPVPAPRPLAELLPLAQRRPGERPPAAAVGVDEECRPRGGRRALLPEAFLRAQPAGHTPRTAHPGRQAPHDLCGPQSCFWALGARRAAPARSVSSP